MLTSDRYPSPNLRTAYKLLHGSNAFSTIDVKSAFNHVPIASGDVHKTTIRTPVATYAFTRTPFGLSTSAQVFQKLIDVGFHLFMLMLMTLKFCKNEKENLKHFSILFQRLSNFDFTINLQKCRFEKNEIRFLENVITPKGILLQMTGLKQFAIFRFQKPLRLCVA